MTAAPPDSPPDSPRDPARRVRMARTLARVAADFRRELPRRLAQAQALADACGNAPGDGERQQAREALLLLLHSLAGTAGTLGLEAVGDAARRGEHAVLALAPQAGGEARDTAALRACIDSLAARIREALAAAP